MKKNLALLSAFLALPTLLLACPPSPATVVDAGDGSAPPPTATVVDSTSCAPACANLTKLGCPEGNPPAGVGAACITTCQKAQAGGFDMKPACLAAATSVAAVQACGSVACKTGANSAPQK